VSKIAYRDIMILLVEDDEGHAELIKDCLRETGVTNPIRRFRDGQEIIDYLFEGEGLNKELARGYLVLLDIRIPKVDGQEVLRRIKGDARLKTLPVVMLTTTDDPREVQTSYRRGCNAYLTKPVDYESFSEMIRYLGQFNRILRIAPIEE